MYQTIVDERLTVAELDAILEATVLGHEQRSSERVEHQTRIQVIYQCPDRAMVRSGVCFGCTEDLSTHGARLLLPQAVTADRFWIRLPSSRERDQAFVECQVQWRECCGGMAESQSRDKLVRCGVRFERLLTREEFDNVLAGQIGESSEPPLG